MANGYMDIMKWKKVVSEAKRADKYLDKVKNWDEDDDDFDDDVYVSDAWEWGTGWIDSWYDAVVENGLYELGDKKVHIIYKSPKMFSMGEVVYENRDEMINRLNQFGFGDNLLIQIDTNDYSDLYPTYIDWFVVAVIDGKIKLIIPTKEGNYIPTEEFWYEWDSLTSDLGYGVDSIEVGQVVDYDGEKVMGLDSFKWNDEDNLIDLSYKSRKEMDSYYYDISWANMKRIG